MRLMLLEAYSAVCDPFGAQIASELLHKESKGFQACLLVVLNMTVHCSRIGIANVPQADCQSLLHLMRERKSPHMMAKALLTAWRYEGSRTDPA